MAIRKLWSSYRTAAGALVATAALGWMVYRHDLVPSRAIVPVVFAWMLALHARDYRATAMEHADRVNQAHGAGSAEE